MRTFIARSHANLTHVARQLLDMTVVHPLKVTVELWEPTRTTLQNSKFHALLTDISKQVKWDGDYLDVDGWKRLMTAGWMRATGRTIKMVRAIDGTGFDAIYQRTAKLSVAEMAELIEFVTAWAVDQGVKFYEVPEVAA